jgi:hypothetical protein
VVFPTALLCYVLFSSLAGQKNDDKLINEIPNNMAAMIWLEGDKLNEPPIVPARSNKRKASKETTPENLHNMIDADFS